MFQHDTFLLLVAVHIQLLVMYWISEAFFTAYAVIWLFSILSALLVNHIRQSETQSIVSLFLALLSFFLLTQVSVFLLRSGHVCGEGAVQLYGRPF